MPRASGGRRGRRVVAGIVGLALVYSAAEWVRVRRLMTRSGHLQQVAEGRRQLGSGPEFTMFVAGDSAGAGTGATSFGTSVAGRVALHLAGDHTVHYRNVSRVGARAVDLLEQELPDQRQDLVLLIVGSNDLVHLTGAGDLERATRRALERYMPLAQRVVIVGPGVISRAGAIPWAARPVYAWLRPSYVKAIRRAADADPRVTFVDPEDVSAEFAEGFGDTVSSIDRFHLNDEGQRWWAERVLLALGRQPLR